MRARMVQAHGGETYTVSDVAVPYFENQGWLVLEYIDDTGLIPPIYMTAAESLALFAQKETAPAIVKHGEDPDVARPSGYPFVIWFGTVDPVNSDDDLDITVYVTDDDGTGGGDSGGVSFTGDAVDVDYDPASSGLAATDVQAALDELTADLAAGLAGAGTLADVQTLIDTALATTPVYHYPSDGVGGSTVVARPATERPVHWFVPAAYSLPTTGTTAGGTIASVDGLDVVTRY